VCDDLTSDLLRNLVPRLGISLLKIVLDVSGEFSLTVLPNFPIEIVGKAYILGIVLVTVRFRRIVWEMGIGNPDPGEEWTVVLFGVLDELNRPVSHPVSRMDLRSDRGLPTVEPRVGHL
jgi:hypothetical protein